MIRLVVLLAALALAACVTPPDPVPLDPSGARVAVGLGHVPMPAGAATSVALTEVLAFVGCGAGGFCVVDVSAPRTPEVIATVAGVRADDVIATGDRLYVVSAPERWSTAGVISIYDVLDPTAPELVRRIDVSLDGAVDVAAHDDRLAIASEAGLWLGVDTRMPTEALTAALGGTPEAVLLGPDRLLAVGRAGATWLHGPDRTTVLVADAKSGRTIGQAAIAGTGDRDGESVAHLGARGPTRLALADGRLLVTTGRSVLPVDVRDPSNPTPGTELPLAGAVAIHAESRTAAVATGDVVLLALDGDAPSVAFVVRTPGNALDVALLDGTLAVADGALGLYLYAIETAPDPPEGPPADA